MSSDRPYRKALSKEEVINEIRNNVGKQFDPNVAIIALEEIIKTYEQ